MRISGLWLQSFRNYQDKAVQFSPNVTVLVGENGRGKTSILEGISLASTGESFRASKIEEMISFDSEFGRVQLKVLEDSDDSLTIEVFVSTGLVQEKKTQKRVFSVNGVRRIRKDVVGICKTVLFRPEDLRLIEGSPGRRRKYLDMPLILDDWQYGYALKTYDQALRQRNKLLEQIREGTATIDRLSYWDGLLLEHGTFIQKQRAAYIETVSGVSFPDEHIRNFTIEYTPSIISSERLTEYERRSVAAGHTLIGPHKDDFKISLDGRDVSAYGSRGQQRLAVLWLKMGERVFLKESNKKEQEPEPILLLDDIFSELDESAKQLIFALMQQGQTIVTTADDRVATLLKKHFSGAKVIDL